MKIIQSQSDAISLDGKSILVSAAAGSGKTYVLTKRIIRRATDKKNPLSLSDILVVTFTKAAAQNLKKKIAEALNAEIAANPQNELLSRQLLALGSAQISTIDSFFQKCVRENFDKLGIPPGFRTADEKELKPIALSVMNRCIEEAYRNAEATESAKKDFLRLEQNSFAKAMDHLMSGRSDEGLQNNLLALYDSFSSYPDGIGMLKKTKERLEREKSMDFFDTSYGKYLKEYLQDIFSDYHKQITDFLDYLETNQELKEKISGKNTVACEKDYCESVLRTLEASDAYDLVKSAILAAPIAEPFPSIRKNRTEELDVFQYVFRKRANDAVKSLKETVFSRTQSDLSDEYEETIRFAGILYDFFSAFEKAFLDEKKSRSLLSYSDIRGFCLQLLEQNGVPTEYAKTLSSRYREIYIDEYQDVDEIQDRIFSLIGKDHRFMVGDIKQSIYGFRGSDCTVFSGLRSNMPIYSENTAGSPSGNCILMSENFRCNKPVIDATNHVCAFLFSACREVIHYRTAAEDPLQNDDLHYAKERDDEHLGKAKNVQFHIFPKEDSFADEEDSLAKESAQAGFVAAEISRLLREETRDDGKKISLSDICILVRGNKSAKKYADALRKQNIPVTCESELIPSEDPVLILLLNLLSAIDNPYNDYPLSEVLLSDRMHYSLQDLVIIKDHAKKVPLFDAMQIYAKDFSDGLSEKIKTTLSFFEKSQRDATLFPIDRFLRNLFSDRIFDPVRDHSITHYLYEEARKYAASGHFAGLSDFLTYFRTLFDLGKLPSNGFFDAGNAVRIMTIHKSKGLEIPIVFLVDTEKQLSKPDLNSTKLDKDFGFCAKLFRRFENGGDNTATPSLFYEIAKRKENEKDVSEEIRVLYVAMTRAMERLYLSGTLDKKEEDIKKDCRYLSEGGKRQILSAKSYLYWLMAKLRDHPSVDFISHTEQTETVESVPLSAAELASPGESSFADGEEMTVLPFREGDDLFQRIPSKIAASRIAPDLLDRILNEEDSEDAVKEQIALMESKKEPLPDFLTGKEHASATDIGTAFHAFLQFCDYDRLVIDGCLAEADRLLAENFISPEARKLLHPQKLEDFVKSNLFSMIRQAKSIRREQTFARFVGMKTLTKNPDILAKVKEKTIFVQGSIDLILEMPNGDLILADYKTDRAEKEDEADRAGFAQKLFLRHKSQLLCYSDAVRELFGKPPKEIYIYSIPLGEAFPFPKEAESL